MLVAKKTFIKSKIRMLETIHEINQRKLKHLCLDLISIDKTYYNVI